MSVTSVATFTSSSDSSIEISCPICLEDQIDLASRVNLKCTHSFHRMCIDPWLASTGKCPICREVIIDFRETNLGHRAIDGLMMRIQTIRHQTRAGHQSMYIRHNTEGLRNSRGVTYFVYNSFGASSYMRRY